MHYKGICSNQGKVVDESYAFEYALKRIKANEKEKAEFIEWYYSGDWIKESD